MVYADDIAFVLSAAAPWSLCCPIEPSCMFCIAKATRLVVLCRSIAKENLFEPVFSVFLENGARYNMLNSCRHPLPAHAPSIPCLATPHALAFSQQPLQKKSSLPTPAAAAVDKSTSCNAHLMETLPLSYQHLQCWAV